MGYHWFDAPAYEDFDKKMQLALKYSLLFGCLHGGYRVMSVLMPKYSSQAILPFCDAVALSVGTAFTGTLTIYGLARMRMRDDFWNYLIGGYAVTAFWGLRYRSMQRFINYGFWFGPLLASVRAFHARTDNLESPMVYDYPRSAMGETIWGDRWRSYGMSPDPGTRGRGERRL
ncbi:NADH dehydrogenase (ubiquinone) B14.7 subunit [Brevipalpus obovatus]|uniref:NADH dehydrogenase (ubiquinone) B14.7 subunit n=1 Tax=Brevipalpus obovatus TaxID=246614 RepID=UPI003D9DF4E2